MNITKKFMVIYERIIIIFKKKNKRSSNRTSKL